MPISRKSKRHYKELANRAMRQGDKRRASVYIKRANQVKGRDK